MNNTKNEFDKRKGEIDLYFDFLEKLNHDFCIIEYSQDGVNPNNSKVDPELFKILKANAFILLYNLVESTIRQSIDAIFNKLYSDKLCYNNLSEELRTLWVKHVSTVKPDDPQHKKDKVVITVEKAINNEVLKLDSKCISISGNIDAQEIRNIANKFGLKNFNAGNGEELEKIKTKRNDLAHGRITFGDAGKDKTFNDLKDIKTSAYLYLESVIDNIDEFIKQGHFKKHNNPT